MSLNANAEVRAIGVAELASEKLDAIYSAIAVGSVVSGVDSVIIDTR